MMLMTSLMRPNSLLVQLNVVVGCSLNSMKAFRLLLLLLQDVFDALKGLWPVKLTPLTPAI